jgi:hypothetical protein
VSEQSESNRPRQGSNLPSFVHCSYCLTAAQCTLRRSPARVVSSSSQVRPCIPTIFARLRNKMNPACGERAKRVEPSPAGIEPATPSLGNLCSIQLSYGDIYQTYRITLPNIVAMVNGDLLYGYFLALKNTRGSTATYFPFLFLTRAS